MRKRGFTLIELLVVIAIIALLMSISLPVVSHVKKQAKATICQMYLRQWGACFAMYAGDNKGSYMPGWWIPSGEARAVRSDDVWMGALRPYFMNQGKIRCCPMATKPGTDIGGHEWGGGGGVATKATFYAWGVFSGGGEYTAGDYGSYGGNAYVYNPPPEVTEVHNISTAMNWRRADVKGAGAVPLMLDAQWWDGWPLEDDQPPDYEGQSWLATRDNDMMDRFCISRHDGYVNSVFLDYSVKRVKLGGLWKLKWHKRYDVNAEHPDFPDWLLKFSD